VKDWEMCECFALFNLFTGVWHYDTNILQKKKDFKNVPYGELFQALNA